MSYVVVLQLWMRGLVEHYVVLCLFFYSYVCRGLSSGLYVLYYSVITMYVGVLPAFYMSFVILLQLCMSYVVALHVCMQGSVQHSVCPVFFCYSYVRGGLSSVLYVLCYSVTAIYAGVRPAFYVSFVILLQLSIRGCVQHYVVLCCSSTAMYAGVCPAFCMSCVLLLQLCMQGSVKRSVCPGVCAGLLDCGSCTIQGQGGIPHSGPTGLTQPAQCAWCVKEAQCQKREGKGNLFMHVSKTVCSHDYFKKEIDVHLTKYVLLSQ